MPPVGDLTILMPVDVSEADPPALVVLDVLSQEDADQVLLRWDGAVGEGGYTFGHTIDPVLERASCAVSMVDLERDSIGTLAALVAPGRNAPAAARRAFEFATAEGTRPTLVYVQPRGGDSDADALKVGQSAIQAIARSAGLGFGEYEAQVLVDGDVEDALLAAIEDFDTVCIGLSYRTDGSGIVYGTVTKHLSQEATGNVALIRG